MSVTSHHGDTIHTLARNGRIPYSRVLRGPHLSDALKLLGSAWLEALGLTIVLVRAVIRRQAPRMVAFYCAHNHVLLSSLETVFHRIHSFHKERKKKQKRKTAAAPTKYSVRTNRALNTYKGRGGWGVTFALSYNSQLWRQDPGGTWKLGRDVGYGLGWKLQAGSLTPYWTGYWSLHHWTFTDASGAEYRLDVNTNGIWTSKEGIYVSYDSNAQRLYFPDGSFWVMGSVAAGTEQDAGTRYPTLMEDSNGNQILTRYFSGVGVGWSNSSARLQEVEDVRAVQPPGQSYLLDLPVYLQHRRCDSAFELVWQQRWHQ